MPVSPIPFLTPIILLILLIGGAIRGRRSFLQALAWVAGLLALVTLPFYIPGWWLMFRANRGSAAAMYELARWHENHVERIQQFILWPFDPDTEAGYRALERSAAGGYPPAMYALGVRLKYGLYVPRPQGWTGPAGNVFPQPERGQPLIDKALRAGYQPPHYSETQFYWMCFRR